MKGTEQIAYSIVSVVAYHWDRGITSALANVVFGCSNHFIPWAASVQNFTLSCWITGLVDSDRLKWDESLFTLIILVLRIANIF